MKIHSLFILKSSGACLYNRDFTDVANYDINFITPFFSAIFSFSEKVISKRLEVLEMGNLRFTFKSDGELIFTILSDTSVSILFLDTRLEIISREFHERFPELEEVKDYQQIEDPEFEESIDEIITGKIFKGQDLYRKVIQLFKDFQMQNEIIGAAALSTDGNIIYSSLPNDILIRSLKELEIRFKTKMVDLPELFYSLSNGQKIFSKMVKIPWEFGDFLIVLFFEKGTPLGMAELNLNKVGEMIIDLI